MVQLARRAAGPITETFFANGGGGSPSCYYSVNVSLLDGGLGRVALALKSTVGFGGNWIMSRSDFAALDLGSTFASATVISGATSRSHLAVWCHLLSRHSRLDMHDPTIFHAWRLT